MMRVFGKNRSKKADRHEEEEEEEEVHIPPLAESEFFNLDPTSAHLSASRRVPWGGIVDDSDDDDMDDDEDALAEQAPSSAASRIRTRRNKTPRRSKRGQPNTTSDDESGDDADAEEFSDEDGGGGGGGGGGSRSASSGSQPQSKQGKRKKALIDYKDEELESLLNQINHFQPLIQKALVIKAARRERKAMSDDGNSKSSTISADSSITRMKKDLHNKDGKDSNEEEEDNAQDIPQDIFTLMAISKVSTSPFWWAFFVFSVQMLIFLLVAINMLDVGSGNGAGGIGLSIPANVELTVRVTQVVAVMIAVATQDDIRTAMNLMYDGYNVHTAQAFPNTNRCKWISAIICRFCEGALGLIVTFFLIITESDSIDLLLNFTAMEFVSQLDEVAFYLAKEGFVGLQNQKAADQVVDKIYGSKKSGRATFRILVLLTLLASMFFGLFMVARMQMRGDTLCTIIHVQFSDDILPEMGTFSGLYRKDDDLFSNKETGGRVAYVEMQSGKARFAYCPSRGVWTFAFDRPSTDFDDPCAYVATSPSASSFDILESKDETWFVLNSRNAGSTPLQHFSMSCYDCDDGSGDDVICSGQGTCVNNQCRCNEESFGIRCEFDSPCESLAIDTALDEFVGTREWANDYSALRNADGDFVTAYDRPVYISETSPGSFDVILFVGRRWIVSYTGNMGGGLSSADALKEYLSRFHGFYSDYDASFVSAPMDTDRPSNAATPIAIEWFIPESESISAVQKANEKQPLSTSLLCSVCNDEAGVHCFFNSTCSAEGICDCTTGASGVRCQIPPNGNGKCDPFFNTAAFGFDGGDCCESSCTSTENYFCGKDATGYLDFGYPFCAEKGGAWVQNGEVIFSENGRFAYSGTAVAMSSSGDVIAVGEPGFDTVRVFDKSGAVWEQRSRDIIGPPESGFGSRIALSGGYENSVRNPLAVNRVVLAVGSEDSVQIFNCYTQGCFIKDTVPAKNFALSKNGRTLAVSSVGETSVEILDYADDTSPTNRPSIPLGNFFFGGRALAIGSKDFPAFYLSISSDGNVIAIGNIAAASESLANGDELLHFAFLTVETYVFQESNQTWANTGALTSENHKFEGSVDSIPVKGIALSGNGLVLAISSQYVFPPESGTAIYGVQVSQWNGVSWENRGSLIHESDEGFGWSVELSEDGSILVVGINDENEAGLIRVYQWNGEAYAQLFNGIPGGSKIAVAVSNDGSTFAVGSPYHKTQVGGTTIVYSSLSSCPNGETKLRISFTTDASGEESRWTVLNSTGHPLMNGGPYLDAEFNSATHDMCWDGKQCLRIQLFDDGKGDGLEFPGRLAILKDTEIIREISGNFGNFIEAEIGECAPKCDEGESVFRMVLHSTRIAAPLAFTNWKITNSRGSVLYRGGPYSVGTFAGDFCVPANECVTVSVSGGGCSYMTIGMDSTNYTSFLDGVLHETLEFTSMCSESFIVGTCAPEKPLECEEGFEKLVTDLYIPDFPDVSWRIQDCDSTVYLSGGDYFMDWYNPPQNYTAAGCVPQASCLTLLTADVDGSESVFHVFRGPDDRLVRTIDLSTDLPNPNGGSASPHFALDEDCLCNDSKNLFG